MLCLALTACNDSKTSGAGAGGSPAGGPLATNPPQAVASTATSAGPAIPVAAKVDTSRWKIQPPFYAAGEEPAWELDLNDDYFTFIRGPGIPEVDAPFVAPTTANGSDVFNTERFKITVEPGACEVAKQKGVANITIQMGGIVYDGCVFHGQSGDNSPSGDEADLVADIPGALGAVDSCLAKLGEPAVVSAIYPRGDEAMGVALRARNGALYECEAKAAAGPAESVDQIEASSAGPWLKSDARFLRAGSGDVSKCTGAKPVVVGGKTLGALLPKTCKF